MLLREGCVEDLAEGLRPAARRIGPQQVKRNRVLDVPAENALGEVEELVDDVDDADVAAEYDEHRVVLLATAGRGASEPQAVWGDVRRDLGAAVAES